MTNKHGHKPLRNRLYKTGRGFTLLEVMVALLIIAIALTGVAEVMGAMLSNATTLRERTYASWIAQNQIVEIRASGTVPKLGRTRGEVEYAGGEWDWEAVVSETGVEDLLRVDVSVSRAGNDTSIRTVTGFVGEPVVPGLANRLWIAGAGGGADSPDDTGDIR